jgi:hypothetical protein
VLERGDKYFKFCKMKTLDINQLSIIEGGGSFWKCAFKVGAGMISGGTTGSMIGTGFFPGVGTAFGAALGLYLGGVGAGLSSSDCMS